MRNAIVLAAGKGTRMKSEMNKVMHPMIDRPILSYTLDALRKAGAGRIVVVTGYQAQSIQNAISGVEFALQEPQLGTGHAVMQCTQLENEEGQTLIINADGPCIQPETIEALYRANEGASLTLLTSILDDGAHYGRIVRDAQGDVTAIVEAKDCNEQQKQIREINAGIYCFDNKDLFEGLKELTTDNAQNEYYLTDLVSILKSKGKKVTGIPVSDPDEVQGINDTRELFKAYSWMKDRINRSWMEKGVQIVDPTRTVIGQDVVIGHDVIVHPNTEILGNSRIGNYVEILPGSYIKDCIIEDGAVIQFCKLTDTVISAGTIVQPMTVKEGNEF